MKESTGNKDERQKLILSDVSTHGNDIICDINWNKHVRGQFIKITMGDRVAVVKKDHLFGIMFMLGDEGQQQKLIDKYTKKYPVTKFFKMIGVTTTKDIRKGEMVNIPIEFTFEPESGRIIIGKGNLRAMLHNKGKLHQF